MSGYALVIKIKKLEEELDSLGMRWGYDKHGRYGDGNFGDTVMVFPKEDNHSLPVYTRDAGLFAGTILELERWLQGVRWARHYDEILKVSDPKKRARKEQDVLNKQLLDRLSQKD